MIDPTNVYVSSQVAAVADLYGGLVGDAAWVRPVWEQVSQLAARLARGHRDREPGARVVLANWHPELIGAGDHEIWSTVLDDDGYLDTVARERGFTDSEAVARVADRMPDVAFEQAVETVLAGDLEALVAALDARPGLVEQRSHWGHRATLLHYTASNGVETHRQRVPLDLADVITVLAEHGADVDATAEMYGGRQTTLHLLLTSSHPHEAGVTAAAADALRAAGAR